MRALFLINPNARQGGERDGELAEALAAQGCELVQDRGAEESISDAIRRHRHDIDIVIIGGGDGTLNDAIPGLMETQLPLGVLPLGTANDLARTLGLPLDPLAACAVITSGRTTAIDVGQANEVYYFNVSSIGLSVDITRELVPEQKARFGVLAYVFTAFRVAYRVRPFHAEIRTAKETHRVRTVQIAVGNGRHYGGGMTVAEGAAIDDGLLDLYSVEVKHWWQVLWLTPAIMRGTLGSSPWVRMLRGASFNVTTRKPKAVNTDGELTTHTPVAYRVLPGAVKVIVPLEPNPALGLIKENGQNP